MKRNRLTALLLVLVLALGLFSGCVSESPAPQTSDSGSSAPEQSTAAQPSEGATEPAAGGDTITIGTIFPRSGNNALLGEQAFYGAEIARQMINEQGGINGVMVEFASADAPGATEASTEANRLIDQQGVNIIIGSLTSGNANAIKAVTERNNAILWETSGIADDVTDNSTYVFRTCDKGGLRGYYGMKFIAEEISARLEIPANELKVAIINEDGANGEAQVKGAQEGAAEFGLQIVAHERYSQNITDHSAMVLRVQQAQPDVIFAVSYVNDAVLLYETLEQYGAMPKVFLGGGAGYTDPNFTTVFGEKSNGVFCIDMPTNLADSVFSDPATVELHNEFVRRYKEMDTKSDAPPLAAECVFMGTWVLLNDVLPNAASMSVEDIKAAAKACKLDETTMGWSVDFDEDGQNRGANSVIGQWQDGKTVTVWPENFATGEIDHLPLGA